MEGCGCFVGLCCCCGSSSSGMRLCLRLVSCTADKEGDCDDYCSRQELCCQRKRMAVMQQDIVSLDGLPHTHIFDVSLHIAKLLRQIS